MSNRHDDNSFAHEVRKVKESEKALTGAILGGAKVLAATGVLGNTAQAVTGVRTGTPFTGPAPRGVPVGRPVAVVPQFDRISGVQPGMAPLVDVSKHDIPIMADGNGADFIRRNLRRDREPVRPSLELSSGAPVFILSDAELRLLSSRAKADGYRQLRDVGIDRVHPRDLAVVRDPNAEMHGQRHSCQSDLPIDSVGQSPSNGACIFVTSGEEASRINRAIKGENDLAGIRTPRVNLR